MWQLVDAAYKVYEICHFVGLKKVTAIVCVFYEKRRLKIKQLFGFLKDLQRTSLSQSFNKALFQKTWLKIFLVRFMTEILSLMS